MRQQHLWLGVVLVLGGALLATRLLHGWYPHDEGVLGQSAERVLLGQVPHRDFDEIYTGLLTYIHAGTFAVLGVSSAAMRFPLFAATMLWLVACYRLLLRFTPPPGAALVALALLVWSVPNYPAPMPSWYNLFLATWGAWALVRWVETSKRRWLLLAGAAGGISFLFKLTGITFLMGGAIAVLTLRPRVSNGGSDRAGAALIIAGLAIVVLALALAVAGPGGRELTRFALPVAMLLAGVAVSEWRRRDATMRERFVSVGSVLAPFALGAAVPVILFAAWFAAHGGLDAFVDGVFVKPFRRTAFASTSPPHPLAAVAAVPLAVFYWQQGRSRGYRHGMVIGLACFAAAVILLSSTQVVAYQVAWLMGWSLPFTVAAIGSLIAARTLAGEGFSNRGQAATVLVLCCVAVFGLLVEFPFAAGIYTLYAVPLSLLAFAGAVRWRRSAGTSAQVVVASFFLLFGALRLMPTHTSYLNFAHIPRPESARLPLERSGLWVSSRDSAVYVDLARLITTHGNGSVWAGPDAPEVYFLTGETNTTRTMFDFLDERPGSRGLAERLAAERPAMVVVNLSPDFSAPIDELELRSVAAGYANHQQIHRFLVLW